MDNSRKIPLLFVLLNLLYACGGGGGDSSSGNNTNTPTPPTSTNSAPTVNAGSDQTVNAGVQVSLTGTTTDSDGTVNTILWQQTGGPTITLSSTNSNDVSFTSPDQTTASTLTFRLTATDNDNATASDTITVSVNAGEIADPTAAFFQESVSSIVLQQCVNCHVVGGEAASTGFLFVNANNPQNLTTNQNTIETYVGTSADKANIILQKVQGLLGHGGDVQLVGGSTDFNNLETFLSMLVDLTAVTPPAPIPTPISAQQAFLDTISTQVVQAKCINCHVASGAADQSRLILAPDSQNNHTSANHQTFVDFLALPDVSSEYILSKVVGGSAHGGAQQLVSGSTDFLAMEAYLALIAGESVMPAPIEFWQEAEIASNELTLRRAAILFTGGLPSTSAENLLAKKSNASLRPAIKALMSGEGFHQFLIESANNRLLTLKYQEETPDFLDGNNPRMPAIANANYAANVAGEDAEDAYWREIVKARNGLALAPLELIARVVEQDLPYSEILTADYTLVNSSLNNFYRSGLSFADSDGTFTFKKGKQQGYVLRDGTSDHEYIDGLGLKIITEGPKVDWPHAGILNEPAFLARYPSTATNRNRARARWTFFHFLDVDIEKSASRTTDPVALADTNNPTMNNNACTVCHTTMDPVAGAFENYGDIGYYRDKWGGKDSLPNSYKDADDSPYIGGDTWYRDMREPGFDEETIDEHDNSLQWLASKIVSDNRFAVAAVKFWWHSIMGTAPATLPDSIDDHDYAERKAVFDSQDAFINEVADKFRVHLNAKEMMADLIESNWFRLVSLPEEQQAIQVANKTGFGQLLTPEQLERKTKSITGQSWGEHYPEWYDFNRYTKLLQDYRLTYGGIDSDGITKRPEQLTSIMSQVALTHANELACPIIINEFSLPDDERLLFSGITKLTMPTETGVRNKLVELHYKLLGESLENNDTEIEFSLALLMQAQANNKARNNWNHIMEDDLTCDVNWDEYAANGNDGWSAGEDPEAMMSAWQTLLVYLMSDFKYIHE